MTEESTTAHNADTEVVDNTTDDVEKESTAARIVRICVISNNVSISKVVRNVWVVHQFFFAKDMLNSKFLFSIGPEHPFYNLRFLIVRSTKSRV